MLTIFPVSDKKIEMKYERSAKKESMFSLLEVVGADLW